MITVEEPYRFKTRSPGAAQTSKVQITPPPATTSSSQTDVRPAAAGNITMSSKTTQKMMASQFMSITGCDEKLALKVSAGHFYRGEIATH